MPVENLKNAKMFMIVKVHEEQSDKFKRVDTKLWSDIHEHYKSMQDLYDACCDEAPAAVTLWERFQACEDQTIAYHDRVVVY